MAQNETPQKALVLAGGGARGSYQVGVWRALTELGWHPQIITGTSVGSLNGAMFALDLYETARDMWTSIRSQDVMELPEETNLTELHQFLRDIVREGGMDVTPAGRDRGAGVGRRRPPRVAHPVRPRHRGKAGPETPRAAAGRDPGRKSEGLPAGLGGLFPRAAGQADRWGCSSSTAATGTTCPPRWHKKMGAEELVCVDLEGVGITLPNRTGLPTTMVRSYWELGDILHFDPDTAKRNIELGYYDTLRAFGRLRGCAYAIAKSGASDADAAAFRKRFDAVQKAVKAKYPVTLTADLALRLANMKDAETAPLEAAAEDVGGVDPAHYYTVEQLGRAFLEQCDRSRIESFAPLFDGSGNAAQAAWAALLPNTFLQALVYRTLTAPVEEGVEP